MAYRYDLDSGQTLYIDNPGMQTVMTIASSNPGQQQQSSSSFQTGKWVIPPSLFRTTSGFVLRIEAQQGQQFILLQGNAVSVLSLTPSLAEAEVLPLQQVSLEVNSGQSPMEPIKPMEPMQPMEPMKPMQPLKMGDMEMQMNPMQMRMGGMSMQMGTPTSVAKRFCTQCGTGVQESDRFCGHCGHPLH